MEELKYHAIVYEFGNIDVKEILDILATQSIPPELVEVCFSTNSKLDMPSLTYQLNQFRRWKTRFNVNEEIDDLYHSVKNSILTSKYKAIVLFIDKYKPDTDFFQRVSEVLKADSSYNFIHTENYEILIIPIGILKMALLEDTDFISYLKEKEKEPDWKCLSI